MDSGVLFQNKTQQANNQSNEHKQRRWLDSQGLSLSPLMYFSTKCAYAALTQKRSVWLVWHSCRIQEIYSLVRASGPAESIQKEAWSTLCCGALYFPKKDGSQALVLQQKTGEVLSRESNHH